MTNHELIDTNITPNKIQHSRIHKGRRPQVSKSVQFFAFNIFSACQNIQSNSGRMHNLDSFLSIFPCTSTCRIKQRHNVSIRFIAFIFFSPCRNVVSNSGRMHHINSLLSNVSLQVKMFYQIAAECTIYRPYFQVSLRFKNIVSKCTNHHPYFHISNFD